MALAGHPGAMAVGVFYEDDGDGYAHQRSGTYREVSVVSTVFFCKYMKLKYFFFLK